VIVIFIGPPASGKGTQATLISGMFKLPYLSTGNILRNVSSGNTQDSTELKAIISSGKLVSTDLVNRLVGKELEKDDYKRGFVLDGYPRNLSQAEFLDKKFPNAKVKVIFFDISYDDLVARATGRYSCKECGAIYNKISVRTRVENECDMCGSHSFVTRDDDNIEVLAARWKEYMEQTMHLVAYYNAKSVLVKIDATMKKEDITHKLVTELKRN
jgi:adenylate kinase